MTELILTSAVDLDPTRMHAEMEVSSSDGMATLSSEGEVPEPSWRSLTWRGTPFFLIPPAKVKRIEDLGPRGDQPTKASGSGLKDPWPH